MNEQLELDFLEVIEMLQAYKKGYRLSPTGQNQNHM